MTKPNQKYCRAKRKGVSAAGCTLLVGHAGDHLTATKGAFGPRAQTWTDDKGKPNEWTLCGEKCPSTPEWRCARPDEHDGPHGAITATTNGSASWSEVIEWNDGDRRLNHLRSRDVVAGLLNGPEKSKAEPEPKNLTDACEKCDLELGEHDGKKCPPKVPAERLAHVLSLIVASPGIRSTDLAPIHRSALRKLERDNQAVYRDGRWYPSPSADTRPEPVKQAEELHREHRASTGRAAIAEKPAPAPFVKPSNMIVGFEVHPVAAVYPLIEGDEFADLVDDVKEHGLREKIVIVDIGKKTFLLDGRNRGRACEVGKVRPRFESYTGKTDTASLIAFVRSKNDRRRHYSKQVRAMIAFDLANLRHGQTGKFAGPEAVTQAQAASLERVSERMVRFAGVVKREGSEKLREAVMRDKIALDAAADAAAKLPRAKQDEIATKALAKGEHAAEVKRGHIRALVRQAEKRAVVSKINKQQVRPMPVGPFRLILVDPSWPYENSDQHDGSRGHIPYPPMPMDDICRLRPEIDRVAHEDCILAMYVTNGFVWAIGKVLEAWGFEQHTMYTWDKGQPGVGTWGRGRTEHLVIASRGKPVHTLNEVETLISAPRREHSRKPDKIAELLAKHCPGPHLEMFAREERPNWAVWGAETDKFESETEAAA